MTDELRRLFEHETDDVVPADHERRIRAGLGALLPGAVAPSDAADAPEPPAPPAPRPDTLSAASATAQGAAIKLTTAIVLGLGMAAGGFAIGRATAPASPPTISPSDRNPSVTTTAPSAAPPSPSSAVGADGPLSPEPSVRPAPPSTSSAAPATTSTAAFDREQSLLERARSALVRHDSSAAQEALDACDREFPRSRHTEERDYLRIQLLRERGDTAQARERARAFLAKYPDSLLRARVEPLAQ